MYDSDSDDDVDPETAILGFDDGPIASTSAMTLDATTSKLGGRPAFWPCHEIVPPSILCTYCSRPSALVCQLYVPQESAEERHRAIFVFSCVQKTCQQAAGCVRAFTASRWDAHLAAEVLASRQEAERERQEPERKAAARDKQVTSNPFSSATNPFSMSTSLPENPFAVPSLASEGVTRSSDILTVQLADLSVAAPNEIWPEDHPVLPAYFITTCYEGFSSSSVSHASSASVKSLATKAEAGWTNEAYEATAESDRVFLAFQERIARDDGEGQVVRVGPDALPFSPGPTRSEQLHCLSCGRERVFEMQIMPHAIDLLGRKLDESKGEELSWSIALIWTCPAVGCADSTGRGSSWIEEGVRLQYE